jgi:DNA-binding transcriptional MerR regulator
MQIGEVAERVGLSLKTVRHYEEVGLVPVARRSPGGFRLYDGHAVERLLAIKRMKPLDFTLEQMRELLDATAELRAGTSVERRRGLTELLGGYQRLVGERTITLRDRLQGAKALQDTLDDVLR